MRRTLSPMRRLLDRIVPDEALEGFAHVGWRVPDTAAHRAFHVVGLTVAAAFDVPPGLIGIDRHGWKRWPEVRDLLPTFTAPRGGVVYAMVPPQHNAGTHRARALANLRLRKGDDIRVRPDQVLHVVPPFDTWTDH